MLPYEFKKYNNNGVFQDPDHPDTHALSHFSFQLFEGRLMMVDIQGCRNGDTYTLTDPGFHSESGKGLGDTNLGVKGFQQFFEKHSCGNLCKQLKLRVPNPSSFVDRGPGASVARK